MLEMVKVSLPTNISMDTTIYSDNINYFVSPLFIELYAYPTKTKAIARQYEFVSQIFCCR